MALGGLGDLMGMMKDLGGVKKRMEEAQETLEHLTSEGSAGGGMVVATVNGKQELVALKIDPEVVDPEDVDLLEDLVTAAIGQAMREARDLQRQEMQKVLGGIQLPPGLEGIVG